MWALSGFRFGRLCTNGSLPVNDAHYQETSIVFDFFLFSILKKAMKTQLQFDALADLGGMRGTRASLAQNFFIFMQCSGEKAK